MNKPRAYAYIRMSTEIQIKGDSLSRQLDLATKYAQLNNLELNESDIFQDIGKSAYDGTNIREGAFGEFMNKVRNNEIERGSYLLVESLDRISRESPKIAVGTIFELSEHGINIVSTAKEKVFLAESTDFIDILEALFDLSRAHSESKAKSHRVGTAWRKKKDNAEFEKVTSRCPSWLQLSDDRTKFLEIEEKVLIVKRIFSESVNGIGNYALARRLNKEKIPSMGRAVGWHNSSINNILRNRAVLGEYQPKQFVNGKWIPYGDPIINYYPKIIEPEIYYSAQALREERAISGMGRKGALFTNLFTKLTRCAYCGGNVIYTNRRDKYGSRRYLVCTNGRKGLDCDNTAWNYTEFEKSFLNFVKEVDLEGIKNSDAIDAERVALEATDTTLKGQLAHENTKLEKLLTALEEVSDSIAIAKRIKAVEHEIHRLEKALSESNIALHNLNSKLSNNGNDLDIKQIILSIQSAEIGENYELRSKIASRLKKLISGIWLAPSGYHFLIDKDISTELGRFDLTDSMREDLLKQKSKRKRRTKHTRYFVVKLESGLRRRIDIGIGDPFGEKTMVTEMSDNEFRIHIGRNRDNMILGRSRS